MASHSHGTDAEMHYHARSAYNPPQNLQERHGTPQSYHAQNSTPSSNAFHTPQQQHAPIPGSFPVSRLLTDDPHSQQPAGQHTPVSTPGLSSGDSTPRHHPHMYRGVHSGYVRHHVEQFHALPPLRATPSATPFAGYASPAELTTSQDRTPSQHSGPPHGGFAPPRSGFAPPHGGFLPSPAPRPEYPLFDLSQRTQAPSAKRQRMNDDEAGNQIAYPQTAPSRHYAAQFQQQLGRQRDIKRTAVVHLRATEQVLREERENNDELAKQYAEARTKWQAEKAALKTQWKDSTRKMMEEFKEQQQKDMAERKKEEAKLQAEVSRLRLSIAEATNRMERSGQHQGRPSGQPAQPSMSPPSQPEPPMDEQSDAPMDGGGLDEGGLDGGGLDGGGLDEGDLDEDDVDEDDVDEDDVDEGDVDEGDLNDRGPDDVEMQSEKGDDTDSPLEADEDLDEEEDEEDEEEVAAALNPEEILVTEERLTMMLRNVVRGLGGKVNMTVEKQRRSKRSRTTALHDAKKAQQSKLRAAQHNDWKAFTRGSFYAVCNIKKAREFVDYTPAASKDATPDANDKRFYFGDEFLSSRWNQVQVDRLVATAQIDRRKRKLPKVDDDYVRALFRNNLKYCQEIWKAPRRRDGETEAEAKGRVEAYRVKRQRETASHGRKTRVRECFLDLDLFSCGFRNWSAGRRLYRALSLCEPAQGIENVRSS
uniref:Uncharacterized protein n=1 Tax=Mycena chlorophos TaxID=658473 RepID=A0ABQ0KZZ0_MYCCL|nr:predicted protein [Mycena chlorophos]